MMKPSEFEKINNYFGINKKLLKPNVDYTKYHYHNCCEVIFPLKGEAVYFNNGQNYCIKPGHILFINSYEMHKSIAGTDTFERFLIMYRGAFVERGSFVKIPDIFSILDERYFGTRMVCIPPELDRKLVGILTNIYEGELHSSMFSLAFQHSYFLLFLIYIADYLISVEAVNNQVNHLNPRIKAIRAYIDENLGKALSLDSIAQHFSISKFYLCRFFSESTGLSPIDYINRMRMISAEKLINQGKYSITEIANMTGYNNLTHFERTFKRIIGTSPRDYKKSFCLKHPCQDE